MQAVIRGIEAVILENYHNHDLLLREGLKNTKQRHALLEQLSGARVPLSAEELYLALKQKGVATSLSTIYRNLEAMVAKNIVSKTTLMNDEKAKFCLIGEQHHHQLICLGCASMVDIGQCPVKELEDAIGDNTNFQVTGHKLEVYGYCPLCRKDQ